MGSWAVCCGFRVVAAASLLREKQCDFSFMKWDLTDRFKTLSPPLPTPPSLFCHQLCVGHIKVVCVWDCHYADYLGKEIFPFITELKLVFSFKGNSGGLILLVVIVCTQDNHRSLIHFFCWNCPTCNPKMNFHNNVTVFFLLAAQWQKKETKIACQSMRVAFEKFCVKTAGKSYCICHMFSF